MRGEAGGAAPASSPHAGRRDLDRAQVRAGWAEVYVDGRRRFVRYPAYHRAEWSARRHRRGVWGRCGGDFHSEQ